MLQAWQTGAAQVHFCSDHVVIFGSSKGQAIFLRVSKWIMCLAGLLTRSQTCPIEHCSSSMMGQTTSIAFLSNSVKPKSVLGCETVTEHPLCIVFGWVAYSGEQSYWWVELGLFVPSFPLNCSAMHSDVLKRVAGGCLSKQIFKIMLIPSHVLTSALTFQSPHVIYLQRNCKNLCLLCSFYLW